MKEKEILVSSLAIIMSQTSMYSAEEWNGAIHTALSVMNEAPAFGVKPIDIAKCLKLSAGDNK